MLYRLIDSKVRSQVLLCVFAASGLAWQNAAAQDVDNTLSSTPKAIKDSMFDKLAQEPEIKEEGSGKWEGSLGLGLTMRRGGTSSNQGSFSLDAERNMRESRLTANALAVRSSENGTRNTDTATADYRGERKLDDNAFGFAGLGLERDGLQDMTMRTSVSSGLGYRWFSQDSFGLNLYGGLAYSMEQYRASTDEKGFEPLVGSELHYQLSSTSRLSQRIVAYPDSVGGGARYAMQGELNTRINSHFGLQLAVLQKYREKVTNQNAHSDTVFFTGITAGF